MTCRLREIYNKIINETENIFFDAALILALTLANHNGGEEVEALKHRQTFVCVWRESCCQI